MVFILCLTLIGYAGAENFEDRASSSSTTVNTFTGNLTTFIELTDTPATYIGSEEYCVKVNAGGTALEFGECGSVVESDPKAYNGTLAYNSTIANMWNAFLSTTNTTYNSYNSTGLIRDWNGSSWIINWNATGFIQNWSAIITSSGDNSSWNQTYANTLYHAITSQLGNTTSQIFVAVDNNTFLKISQWNSTNSSYALNQTLADMWTSFLGATNTTYRTVYNGSFTMDLNTTGVINASMICNATNCYAMSDLLSGGGGNIFDQWLNTTSNVTFNDLILTGLNSNLTTNDAVLTFNGYNSLLGGNPSSGGINIYQTRPEAKDGIWWDSYDSNSSSIRETGWIVCHYNSSVGGNPHSHCSWETLDNSTGTPSINSHFIITYGSNLSKVSTKVSTSDFIVGDIALFNISGNTRLSPNRTLDIYPNNQLTYALRFSNNSDNYTMQVLGSGVLQFADDLYLPSNKIYLGAGQDICITGGNCLSSISTGNPFDQTLNTTSNVQFSNVTLAQKIIFALGETIDNIVDGWIAVIGSLTVSGTVNATQVNGTVDVCVTGGNCLTETLRVDQWNATNTSYALSTEPKAFNGTLMRVDQWNSTNTTYLRTDQWNATNTTYRTLDNGTITVNVNVTNGNLSIAQGSYLSGSHDKSANITYNGTHWIWY